MRGFGCCPGLQELPALLPQGHLQRIASRRMGRAVERRLVLPQPLPRPDQPRRVLLPEAHLSYIMKRSLIGPNPLLFMALVG